jgi:hypothetical protein
VESVQLREAENQEVYLTFSESLERIWLESKKRLLDYVRRAEAGEIGIRSQSAFRLYSWAKKQVAEALDLAIAEINKKTDLMIEIESLQQANHRRVTGSFL